MKNMIRDKKSISYAFVAKGIQLYIDLDKDYFLINQLVCKKMQSSLVYEFDRMFHLQFIEWIFV